VRPKVDSYAYSTEPDRVLARIHNALAVQNRDVVGKTRDSRFELRRRWSPFSPARPVRLEGSVERTDFGCSVHVSRAMDPVASMALLAQLVFVGVLVALGVLASFRQPIWLVFALFPLAVVVISWLPVLVRMRTDEGVLRSWLESSLRGLPLDS
jgi:hypothetical protein